MSQITIGLTGGVASGKSEIARRFEALGVFVADADVIARGLVAPGGPVLAQIVEVFGATILHANGALDRPALRQRVFADESARKRLESLMHPPIRAALHAACMLAPVPYAIAAIPLLTEGGGRRAYPWLNRILVVDVPRDMQLRRLMQRDGVHARLAEQMVAAQATRTERLAIADDIIVNEGSLDALTAQVAALDMRYAALSFLPLAES
ncbi:MAG: dephospho-CoA kinase [Luteimonas sp.]